MVSLNRTLGAEFIVLNISMEISPRVLQWTKDTEWRENSKNRNLFDQFPYPINLSEA